MIRLTSFTEIEKDPSFQDLLDAYGVESALAGLPAPNCQIPMYKALEAAGVIHILGSYNGDELTGFISLVITTIPHYGAVVAHTESYFVCAAHRKTGAGLALLRAAERFSAHKGAVGLLVSAPLGGKLAEVLPKTGYTETNRVFFRKLDA
mgnify:CR=1 FL=1|tara:strand:+ start:2221 stop:2670 length:450 start_codon:yes stop_codon:yes gene_type:complete